MSTIVIVGGGLAGAKTSEALRAQDFDGEVVLFGREEHLPYERPPLSKDFLAGKKTLPDFTVHDADWYRDNRIDLRPGTSVSAVDAASKTVILPDGSSVAYDKLVLATGSSPRRLDIPGAHADGVFYLRSIDDATVLTEAIDEGQRLAIIGGGWIGLEVAASARQRGIEVVLAERGPVPLQKILGPEVAEVFAALHRDHGVDLRTQVDVAEILTTDGKAAGLRFGDGTSVTADMVLIAVGAVAELDLATSAGLVLSDGGVQVDAGLRSSDPAIYAVGDIAAAQHRLLGRRIRVEHWANALNQPAIAATNLVGGDAEYDNLPYFFTDQYDLGMEYVGLASADDEVVIRGDLATREFVALWLTPDGKIAAGMQVNIWDQLDDIKQLITGGVRVDARRLADISLPLNSFH